MRYADKANAHRLRVSLEPGQLVLAQNIKVASRWGYKLDPRWFGPYEVVERTKKGSYILKELGEDGPRLARLFAARRIRRYWSRGIPVEDLRRDYLEEGESLEGGASDLGEEEAELEERFSELEMGLPTHSLARDFESDIEELMRASTREGGDVEMGVELDIGQVEQIENENGNEANFEIVIPAFAPETAERMTKPPKIVRHPKISQAAPRTPQMIKETRPMPQQGPTLIVRPYDPNKQKNKK